MTRRKINIIGNKFEKLTVKEFSHTDKNKKRCFVCECSCGKQIIVPLNSLRTGNTRSCGCLKNEMWIEKRTKHGFCGTRIYQTWANMIQRTTNDNNTEFKNYGGRGITVCQEWKDSFDVFYNWAVNNGYRDDLTIDRIDNNKGYYHENCRWITQKEQARNKRSNHIISFNGKKMCIAEWSDLIGVSCGTLHNRIRRGWSIEKTLTTPLIVRS